MGERIKGSEQGESSEIRYSQEHLGHLIESAIFRVGGSVYLEVAGLPPTLNEMYLHKGHRRILKKSAHDFRKRVFYSLGKEGRSFCPGLAIISINLYSPRWLTKEGRLRNMDLDNRIKAILDAIQYATGMPDFRFMAIRALKIPSDTERTVVRMEAILHP